MILIFDCLKINSTKVIIKFLWPNSRAIRSLNLLNKVSKQNCSSIKIRNRRIQNSTTRRFLSHQELTKSKQLSLSCKLKRVIILKWLMLINSRKRNHNKPVQYAKWEDYTFLLSKKLLQCLKEKWSSIRILSYMDLQTCS